MKEPSAPDNRALLACVRAWAAINCPGCRLQYITIHLEHLPVPIQLTDGPLATVGAIGAGNGDTDERNGRGLSPCILDILKVLREVKRPLSRTRLLEEMARRGLDWSERTVAGYLAQLVQDGTLENPEDGRPRGYRLADGET